MEEKLVNVTICMFKLGKMFDVQTKTFIQTSKEDAELLHKGLPQSKNICVCYEGMKE
jgi:hypothetical protein